MFLMKLLIIDELFKFLPRTLEDIKQKLRDFLESLKILEKKF